MTYSRRRRNLMNNNPSWAELIGTLLGVGIIAVALFALGALFMLIPAWIVHWGLVNLFNYTVLSVWQVWGIIVGLRLIFSGLVTVNKN